MEQITFADLLSQETKRDPITFATGLREHGSLVYLPGILDFGGGWIATSYDVALTLLKDPRLIKDPLKISQPEDSKDLPSMQKLFSMRRDLLVIDPPDHTRLRHLVSKAFTPRAIEQLRQRIQQIVDELLDEVASRGEMDLIADFAFPLPIIVISEMLGVPLEDRQQFRFWSHMHISTHYKMEERMAALEEFLQYIRKLVNEKRKQPGSDLISSMIQAEENGDKLSEAELVSTAFLLILAGHETTVNLIGSGTLTLFQHPEQMDLLRNNPDLLPSAIEELLRYTVPVSFTTARWASEDIPIDGKVIRKGEVVFIAFSAVNIDPQQFQHPEALDITREENRHMSFGKGIHACLGAPLARLEGQIAIGTLLRRLPNLRLACSPEELTWDRSMVFRGLVSMPVTF